MSLGMLSVFAGRRVFLCRSRLPLRADAVVNERRGGQSKVVKKKKEKEKENDKEDRDEDDEEMDGDQNLLNIFPESILMGTRAPKLKRTPEKEKEHKELSEKFQRLRAAQQKCWDEDVKQKIMLMQETMKKLPEYFQEEGKKRDLLPFPGSRWMAMEEVPGPHEYPPPALLRVPFIHDKYESELENDEKDDLAEQLLKKERKKLYNKQKEEEEWEADD